MKYEAWRELFVYLIWHLYFILEKTKSQRDNVTFQRTQSEFMGEPRLEPLKS